MALNANQKQQILAKWASDISARREAFDLRKPDLVAAITAIDNWLETNATAFNSAIPQPARATLTTSQKAELLALVAIKRYGG